jgi:hypothetical protein
MLDCLVGVVEHARIAGDPAARRHAPYDACRLFTLGATSRAENLARELGP